MLTRRGYLLCSLAALAPNASGALAAATTAATANQRGKDLLLPRTLVFPRDHGAHNDFRIEWWYLTGWLDGNATTGAARDTERDTVHDAAHEATDGSALGFQLTFFRVHTAIDPANPSRFAAHQVLLAHAALADPARGALLQEQRIGRTGFGIAAAAKSDTDLELDRWLLARTADGTYRCSVRAREFAFDIAATPTQPLLMQGEAGLSRKGPSPAQASFYYSQPQLAVRGKIERAGGRTGGSMSRSGSGPGSEHEPGAPESRSGVAWLDHEWAHTLLAADAAGWDWLGMNLADGSALTAFQIRRRDDPHNDRPLFAYASLRAPNAMYVQTFAPAEVRWLPLAQWSSPRTGARWPVAQQIRIGARTFATEPLFADQELDSRAGDGVVYWEGASHLLEDGQRIGRGYLELTGYQAPVQL